MSEKDILERLSKLPTGNICDGNYKGGNMDPSIKPIDPATKIVGRAYTVKCQPSDNLTIFKGIIEAAPGSVLVVDAGGYSGSGYFGEIMALDCLRKGIVGLVIDGACRDADDIQELGFPVFSRGLNPGGTVKETVGTTNEPIQCGGKIVKTGDIIIGDRDGVVVIPSEKALEVVERAEAIAAKEVQVKQLIKEGKSTAEIYGHLKKFPVN